MLRTIFNFVGLCCVSLTDATTTTQQQQAHFVCDNSNDVYQLLVSSTGLQPFGIRRHDSLEEAFSEIGPGDGLFILNENYPAAGVNISTSQYQQLASLLLLSSSSSSLTGVFLEMPTYLPQDPSTAYVPSSAWYFDRLVAITNDTGAYNVPFESISQAQGAFFSNYPPLEFVNSSVLVYAHVAGSSQAVFGIPPPDTLNPVLFTTNITAASSPSLVWMAAIKLSCIISCRYTPIPRWLGIWNFIISSVMQVPSYNAFPSWDPLVRPSFTKPTNQTNSGIAAEEEETLSSWDVRRHLTSLSPEEFTQEMYAKTTQSVTRATDWLQDKSQLLIIGDTDICLSPYAPSDDATIVCMLEGYSSKINENGTQQIASDTRMDCSAETAMAFALRSWLDNKNSSHSRRGNSSDGGVKKSQEAATLSSSNNNSNNSNHNNNNSNKNNETLLSEGDNFAYLSAALLNFTFLYSAAAQGPHANQSDPVFGFLEWGVSSPSWALCTYADDNARVLVSATVATSILQSQGYNTSAWDAVILRSYLANLRIASPRGFRPGRINFPDLEANGWQYYANAGWAYANTSCPQPHYQAQLWSGFLWAYAKTQYEPFYVAARNGIAETLSYYPDEWRWTEYISEEQCRLILSIAWLLRADQVRTPGSVNATHLSWLTSLTADFLSHQQQFGGIQDWLGSDLQKCDACPPQSNDAYGDGEAPLVQTNGDTLTDQLYSNNYALVSLWEAYQATGDMTRFGIPAAALASYVTSIQLTSDAFPELDGSWMRGFDYELWDFWGSAADSGWGPWSIETGWSATWIIAGLSTVSSNTSLWELTNENGIDGALFSQICPEFFSVQECTEGTRDGW